MSNDFKRIAEEGTDLTHRNRHKAKMCIGRDGRPIPVSFTEAASLPLNDLLVRYTEEDDRYELQYPIEGLRRYIAETIPNILYSTGLYITANRKDQKSLLAKIEDGRMLKNITKDVARLRTSGLWNDTPLMLDSGGHQIYMNYLCKANVDIYIKYYFQKYVSLEDVDLAFSLDIHMDYPLIEEPREIWELNVKSVEEMYKHDISKIIWVYQFRGNGLNSIWNKLHSKYNIFENFNKFAIGGVAKLSKSGVINFPLFFPGSTNILAGIKKAGIWSDYYQYHILGVMTPTDFIQFALISRIANNYHNIPLHLTFDSAKIFRGQAAAAMIDYIVNDHTVRISFKSKDLDKRVEGLQYHPISNQELLRKLIRALDAKYGYVDCTHEDVYVENDKGSMVLNKKYWTRIIQLSYIYLNNALQKALDVADELLAFHDVGNELDFKRTLSRHLVEMNRGHQTRNLLGKEQNMFEAVTMMKELNVEKANKYNARIFPNHKVFSHGDQEYLKEDEDWDHSEVHSSVRFK